MTPRKETEPTKEQREAARKIASVVVETVKSFGHLGFAMGKETDDAIAAFLARRDEARDAEVVRPWRDAWTGWVKQMRLFDHHGMVKTFAEQMEAAIEKIASPSPASSEPPHDPDCTHPVGGCVRKNYCPEQTEKKPCACHGPNPGQADGTGLPCDFCRCDDCPQNASVR